jgi:hypothetical protein
MFPKSRKAQLPGSLVAFLLLERDLPAHEFLQLFFGGAHEMLARRLRDPLAFNHDPLPETVTIR